MKRHTQTMTDTPSNLAKLHEMAKSGTPLFRIWVETEDTAATSVIYFTEEAARADIARLEADDRTAGIYEPNYYTTMNATEYYV